MEKRCLPCDCSTVKRFPVYRCSFCFVFSGPSILLVQASASGTWGILYCPISHEQTQSNRVCCFLTLILIYISLWIDCLFEIRNIAVCFLGLSLPSHYRVTDEALLAETTEFDPVSVLWMFSLLLKKPIFDFYWPSLQLVLCSVVVNQK